jgi:hypothetical protein
MPDVPLPFDQGLADSIVPGVEQIKAQVLSMLSDRAVMVGR